MIKSFIKLILWPISKPWHWLFDEEIFTIIEEQRYVDLRHETWSNGGETHRTKSEFYAKIKNRCNFEWDLLDRNGDPQRRTQGPLSGGYRPNNPKRDCAFASKEQAQEAIDLYRLKNKLNKNIEHYVGVNDG